MKINKKDPLIVYWSPFNDDRSVHKHMYYDEPNILFNELIKNKEKTIGRAGFFNCPAVSDRLKTSFVFRNNLKTKFSYDFSDINNPIVLSEYGIPVSYYKGSSIIGGAAVALHTQWIFFAEEPVDILINTPMYHKPQLNNHGIIVPGKVNAGKWFRPLTGEIQLWNNKGTAIIEEDEPLFYLEVLTDRPVILKRFTMTNELKEYAESCYDSTRSVGHFLPLFERYKRFVNTKTNEIVLREIKKNVI